MRAILPLLLAGCAAAPRELVSVPGTSTSLDLIRVGKIWIAARETTWADFDAFYEHPEEEAVDGVTRPSAGKNYLGLSGLPPDFFDARRPVTGLRWHSAMMYCEWLSKKTGLVFRLPTKTERGEAGGAGRGWTSENSGERTHEAGEFPPDERGFQDLLGNAWEYVLEPGILCGGGWNTPAAERQKIVPDEWVQADPNRPASLWWVRTDFAQGFRVARVPGVLGTSKDIDVRLLSSEERRIGPTLVRRVNGELVNRGTRVLEELGLKVHYLKPDGRPHWTDASGGLARRATFSWVYPVLGEPLGPGQRRRFEVDIPLSFDAPEQVQEAGFGALVVSHRYSE